MGGGPPKSWGDLMAWIVLISIVVLLIVAPLTCALT